MDHSTRDEQPRLVKIYGDTETGVCATFRPIERKDVASEAHAFIGFPIPDTRLYLLDTHGQLVPTGVPGEIHVGGPGLAKGYLNQPELTVARFVPDPSRPAERLYRTGALARRSTDGEIEYLGRIDRVVNIHGRRIRLWEVELALAEHPAVSGAIVVIRPAAGDDRLAAYVVLTNDKGGTTRDDLRAYLRDKLPVHMVPHSVEIVSALPFSRDGKIDCTIPALVTPTIREPRELAEDRVAAEVKIGRIGADDNIIGRKDHISLVAPTSTDSTGQRGIGGAFDLATARYWIAPPSGFWSA